MQSKEAAAHVSRDRDAYKRWTHVSLRYGDTDRLGHVNNAVFVTLLEAGRVDLVFEGAESPAGPGKTFVIANLKLDFLAEINFPGVVEVGTTLIAMGRSSVKIAQVLYKDGLCCAAAESTLVLIDEETRRSTPIDASLRARIESKADGG